FIELCLNINHPIDEFLKQIENIKTWSQHYQIRVGSIGRWGTDRIDQKGRCISKEVEISYNLIDVAAELECPNFVCGCNYIEELSYYENCTAAIDYLKDLILYAKGKGVQISTYNCRWNNFIHSDPAWTVIHGHLPELGIKYDPSHCYYAGGDYLAEMKKWGKRFYHVHIKGSLAIQGERFDDPPAGLDMTNWGAFMAILYAQQYQGGLSIEPHSPSWQGKLGEQGVDFSIRYIRQFLF
ncbi:MAG: sugar phosphate isomerase/epimerase, partial [Epulopiscium sp.]|nr:sugar phosphate isomerase/epimerase [Candidatus Epulonipiscium sp.]